MRSFIKSLLLLTLAMSNFVLAEDSIRGTGDMGIVIERANLPTYLLIYLPIC